MEEKNLNQQPKPDLTDAIHPELGNGALFEENLHAFLLRIPDPSKILESKLKDEAIVIQTAVSPVVEAKMVTQSDTIEEVSASVELKVSKKDDITKDKKKSTAESESTEPTKSPPATPVISKKSTGRKKIASPVSKEPELKKEVLSPQKALKKASRPGKLVRKAAKSEERKLKATSAPKKSKAKKTPEKAPEKVQAAKPVARKTVRKTVDKKPLSNAGRKQVSQNQKSTRETQVPLEMELSPYIQWLKSLSGTDYVHPYDDDFALHQGLGDNREGISETYADLLAAQGHIEQAIEMYMRLIEKYPEKSSFFAAKIEGLQ
jgi:hypothetical protein